MRSAYKIPDHTLFPSKANSPIKNYINITAEKSPVKNTKVIPGLRRGIAMDAWGNIVQQDSNAFFVEQHRKRVECIDRAKSYRRDLEKQVSEKQRLRNLSDDSKFQIKNDIGTQLRDQELKVERQRQLNKQAIAKHQQECIQRTQKQKQRMRTMSAGSVSPLGDRMSKNFVLDLTKEHDTRVQKNAADRGRDQDALRNQIESKYRKTRMYQRKCSETRGGEIARALEFGQNAYHQD